jgi:hypothetical protein
VCARDGVARGAGHGVVKVIGAEDAALPSALSAVAYTT